MQQVHWTAVGCISVLVSVCVYMCMFGLTEEQHTLLHLDHPPPSVGNGTLLLLTIDWWSACSLGNAGWRGKKYFFERFKKMDFWKWNDTSWMRSHSADRLTFTCSWCQRDERKDALWRFKQQRLRKYTTCLNKHLLGRNEDVVYRLRNCFELFELLSNNEREEWNTTSFQTSWLINESDDDFEGIV